MPLITDPRKSSTSISIVSKWVSSVRWPCPREQEPCCCWATKRIPSFLSPQSSAHKGTIPTFPKSSKPLLACLVRGRLSPASVKDGLGSGTHLKHLGSLSRSQDQYHWHDAEAGCRQRFTLCVGPAGWHWHLGWHLFATRVKFPHSFYSLKYMACAFQGSLPTEIC